MFNPHSSNPARRPRALGGNPIAPESLHPQKNQQNNQHRRSNVQRNNYHRASNIRQNINNNNNNTRNKNHFTQDDSIYFVHNDLISNNETDFNDNINNINQRNNRRNNHSCRKSDQFQQEDLEYDQTLKESLKEFKQKEVQDLFEEIYNPVCLRQILQKLSGVDPDNSLFQKFYSNE